MEAEFSTLWGAVTVSQSPNCVEGLLAAPGSATFFPLETPLSSCPHSRVAASDGLGPCCKWQQQSKSGHGYQEAEVVWKHYRIVIVHRGSVFVTKQRGHQLNIKKKKIGSTLSNASLMAFHCQRGQQANQSLRRIGCPSPGLCA